jgi:tetratricopeptide (TPR) repeat protein
MKRLLVAGAFLLGLSALALPAHAQTGTARGKVLDEKGQPIEGAKVLIEFQGGITRKADTTTNKKGEYTRVGLPPGQYKITASKDGYAPQFVETRVNLGDATEIPELRLAAAGKGGAAGADATNKEMQASFDKALKAADAGQFDEAEAAYKDVLAKNPARPEVVWNQLGLLYTKKKDVAAAEGAFRKAIEAKADFADAYTGLAATLLATGQGPKAIETLGKAATDFPQDGKIQFANGWALFAAGQAAEAEAAFKKAEALDATNPEIQYFLGSIAVGQNKIPDAVAHLEKYVSMNPTNPQNLATAQGLLAALKPKK